MLRRFPKMGVPPNHPSLDGIFHCKPTISLDAPIYRNSGDPTLYPLVKVSIAMENHHLSEVNQL